MGRLSVFVDTSVFFAASYSATGASREIIRYALREEVTLVISEFVLEEAERNLSQKRPEMLSVFRQSQNAVPFEIVEPSREEVLQMKPYTAFKDAAIFAAAKKAEVDYLVSLDRRHMIDIREQVEEQIGLKILLPHELLEILRQGETD